MLATLQAALAKPVRVRSDGPPRPTAEWCVWAGGVTAAVVSAPLWAPRLPGAMLGWLVVFGVPTVAARLTGAICAGTRGWRSPLTFGRFRLSSLQATSGLVTFAALIAWRGWWPHAGELGVQAVVITLSVLVVVVMPRSAPVEVEVQAIPPSRRVSLWEWLALLAAAAGVIVSAHWWVPQLRVVGPLVQFTLMVLVPVEASLAVGWLAGRRTRVREAATQ